MSISGVAKTLAPYHLLIYSTLFGTTAYQSFYAGITAYKALPLDMFGKLQDRIFPGYFLIQTVLSAALLVVTPFSNTRFSVATLGVSLATAGFNYFVVMPNAHGLKDRRETQVRLEGKSYKDPTASPEMKLLNKKFMKWHGVSMLNNFAGFFALVSYGFYLTAKLRI